MSAISLRQERNTGVWPLDEDTEYRRLAREMSDTLDAIAATPATTLADCVGKARAIHACCDPVTLHAEAALSLAADLARL